MLANFYSRFNMVIEPKGKFFQAIENILYKVSLYEYDMKKVKQFGKDECLPFDTIADILTWVMDNKKCLLMTPINNFFNQINIVVQPLKAVVKRTKRQVITDINYSFFVEEATRQIRVMDQLNL